jgi:gluconate 5-dehydrogenase
MQLPAGNARAGKVEHRVVGAATDSAAAVIRRGGRASGVEANVTDEPSVEAMVNFATESYGQLDVIFCNAGISDYYNRVDQVDLQQWRRVIDVNLTGCMLSAKHASRVMIPRERGKIILTASIWGLIGSDSVPVPAYAASKGAVVNLTRELALELAPFGITVNAIAPGFFDTNLGRDKAVDPSIKQTLRDASTRLIPTHRRGSPQDIEGTAVYLASPASDMVNGHVLVIDQGCVAR